MHWGHAVSRDLAHWKELPVAIYPRRFGDWVFSGSALVDTDDTAGFKTGDEDVIVAAYTSTGRGECIAYSNDRGRTFTDYEGNPVVKHRGRDPKVIWYAPGKHWVMAVYIERLHERRHALAGKVIQDGENVPAGIAGDRLHIRTEFEVGDAKAFGVDVQGARVAYDVQARELSCKGKKAPLRPVDGKVRLEILVDRLSIEVFANDGRIYMPMAVVAPDEDRSPAVYSRGGKTTLESLETFELRSAWAD